MNPDDPTPGALAVLVSGGLDSAILLGERARAGEAALHPIYVRHGLYWEAAELRHLRRYLEAIAAPALRPLTILDLPVRDAYGEHWSLSGRGVPDASAPDESVELPGRNLLMLAKALLWCHRRGVGALALATLKGNPFPDATPEFFLKFEQVFNQSVGGGVRVVRPYAGLGKREVMRRGSGLPLGLTFSCIRPEGDRHCGACNKCGERRAAFEAAGMVDPTEYAGGVGDQVPPA